MNHAYCTIVTKSRLYQFLAMQASMVRHIKSFKIFVLCVDDSSYLLLKKCMLDNTSLIKRSQIENKELLSLRYKRKLNEYCWTLKPSLFIHLFDRYKQFDTITYIDSDIYFFSDPSSIYIDVPDFNILLTTHIIHRRYNAGFVCFRRSETAKSALVWWRKQCYDWCSEHPSGDKFGDQGYLNELPKMYSGVENVKTPGVNVAPWNYHIFNISSNNGIVTVNDKPLIFYHFSGLRVLTMNEFALRHKDRNKVIPCIHHTYFKQIQRVILNVKKINPGFNGYENEAYHRRSSMVFRLNIATGREK